VAGTNVLTVRAENGGDKPNPAGLIGALRLRYADGSQQLLVTDGQWQASLLPDSPGALTPVQVLGGAQMAPWRLDPQPPVPPLYPEYEVTAAVLRDMGVVEDFGSAGPVRYTHRRTPDHEIYFVANRSDQVVETKASFRVDADALELWDPVRGATRTLPQFTRSGAVTVVPLRFEPYESYFMVFSTKPAQSSPSQTASSKNFAEFTEFKSIKGPWEVSFDATMGAPSIVIFDDLVDWTQRPEPGLKHYSGLATYRASFSLSVQNLTSPMSLDLGKVEVMARVRVNGVDCGVVWTAPWRVDISHAVKAGDNSLEIEVANLWPNRMIGDAAAPEPKFTQTTYRPYKAIDPLLPSGMLGPLRLVKTEAAGR